MNEKEKDRAALFTNGGSQAVRLPKAYRFQGSHVLVHRQGRAVILEPADDAGWPDGYWESLAELGPVTDDFAAPEHLADSGHRDRLLDELDRQGGQ